MSKDTQSTYEALMTAVIEADAAAEKARDEFNRLDKIKREKRDDLLKFMISDEVQHVANDRITAYRITETKYSFEKEGRPFFNRWVRRNNAFELYTATIKQSAMKERVENARKKGWLPPGIKAFEDVRLGVLRKKGK